MRGLNGKLGGVHALRDIDFKSQFIVAPYLHIWDAADIIAGNDNWLAQPNATDRTAYNEKYREMEADFHFNPLYPRCLIILSNRALRPERCRRHSGIHRVSPSH
jgi:hypothetical protein